MGQKGIAWPPSDPSAKVNVAGSGPLAPGMPANGLGTVGETACTLVRLKYCWYASNR